MNTSERGNQLLRLADLIESHADELALDIPVAKGRRESEKLRQEVRTNRHAVTVRIIYGIEIEKKLEGAL